MPDRPIHLVGSVPLEGPADVFRAVGSVLGTRIQRIPDGETGQRLGWIRWQREVFERNPDFEPVSGPGHEYHGIPLLRVRQGVDASRISFGDLGYAHAATKSYAAFRAEKQAGNVHPNCKFQVSLPTPMAPVAAFVVAEDQLAVETSYTDHLLAELDELLASIPHEELAIQWDVAREFMYVEGVMRPPFEDVMGGIVERLELLSQRVPDSVELGFHLCYGDSGHQHFVEPADTENLVKVANAISETIARPISWIHLPVPRSRDDDAYFAPLKHIDLHPETTLFLGLIHYSDGLKGARRRMATARQFLDDFGIATECGFGRRPPETISELLAIHVTAAGES